MAKIKKTKVELKAQRESLKRFERFLPMLQLKKQQLQVEIQSISGQIAAVEEKENGVRAGLDRWISLLSEPVDLESLVAIEDIESTTGNIAGVAIPVFGDVKMKEALPDLFETPTWVDDAVDTVSHLVRLRVEREILEEQRRRVTEELRVTSQRVNLFEKVKIPECRENIRVIRIFLGDEQTAAVARGKIAKRRTEQIEYGEEQAA